MLKMKKIAFRIQALIVLICFYIIKPFSYFYRCIAKQNIYIFTERGFDAEDNAFVMYQFSKDKVNAYYLIKKNNNYKDKFNKNDKFINYGTFKHLFLLQCAEYIITTHGFLYIPVRISINKVGKYFKLHSKIIFLQHGVMMNKIDGLNYYDMFVTSTQDEFEFIKKETGLDETVVKCVGLPRFDLLNINRNKLPKKQILIMPTWRNYLKNKQTIKDSLYLKRWLGFINDPKLKKELSTRGYEIVFYPHVEIRKFIDSNLIFKTKKSVQELLIESAILITDYSSVQFDFAYLFKPVLYYQFDYSEHYSKHHQIGYFNEETKGFGPVAYEKETLITNLISMIENPSIQEKYTERAKNTFKYIDSNNRQRVFDELKNVKKHYY